MAYWVSGSSTPFDDTLTIKSTFGLNTVTSGGIDTRTIDPFRQGIELNTIDKFFIGIQPKLWGGSIKFDGTVSHLHDTRTYGQSVSFPEFFGTPDFNDKLRIFDPVLYIELEGTYPFPLLFNKGPQQNEENIIEPLTIPFRKSTHESVGYLVRNMHGSYEDGQNDRFGRGTIPLSSFYKFGKKEETRSFFDGGEVILGDILSGSIVVPGYASFTEQKIRPFSDQISEFLLTNVTSGSLKDTLIRMSGYRTTSGFIPFGQRSGAAGRDVYGFRQATVGTDSLSFIGRLRGSG